MKKILKCSKVEQAGDCDEILEGETEEELLEKAARHSIEVHGVELTEDTKEQIIKPLIEEEEIEE